MDYARLKEVIDLNVRPNGRQAITGYVLNAVLNAVLEELGAGWQFAGVAKPGEIEVPAGGEDAKLFWLMAEYGIYTFDGGKSKTGVGRREARLMTYDGGEWKVEDLGMPNLEAVDALKADLTAEAARAEAAEEQLTADLKSEADRAKGREDEIAADVAEESARAQAKEVELSSKIADETTRAKGAESGLGEDIAAARQEAADGIGAINAKIPAQASATNKLADKEFVNSSISTATATFRGTFASLDELKAAEADKNDYAFYVHPDAAGNTVYDKYTYDGAEWRFEYALNNSSFTAAQWAAINSGATAAEVAKIGETADGLKAETERAKAAEKANADETADVKTSLVAEVGARLEKDQELETEVTAAAEAAQAAVKAETSAREAADNDIAEAVLEFSTQFGNLINSGYLFGGDASSGNILLTQEQAGGRFFWFLDRNQTYTYGDGKTEDTVEVSGVVKLLTYDVFATTVNKWEVTETALMNYLLVAENLEAKQNTLVSGKNIKTVNGESLLGSGNLAVSGGLETIQAGQGGSSEVFNGCPPSAATGTKSHVEGGSMFVTGQRAASYAHAEGAAGKALGESSHAEGSSTTYASYSHAEGMLNEILDAQGAHVEGVQNVFGSHVGSIVEFSEGFHGGGKYAYGFSSTIESRPGKVLRVIGCGTSTTRRKNAFVMLDDGSLFIDKIGDYYGGMVETTCKSLQEVIADLTARVEALEAK